MRRNVGNTDLRKAETEDGLVSFSRSADGEEVTFRLNYRDPEQRVRAERTREGITTAVDTLKDQAISAMRDILDRLREELEPQLSDEGRHDDFVDPEFPPVGTDWKAVFSDDELVISLAPYTAAVHDDRAGHHADRFLGSELLRGLQRRRQQKLLDVYEEIRRELIDRLINEQEA